MTEQLQLSPAEQGLQALLSDQAATAGEEPKEGERWVDPDSGDQYLYNGHGYFEGFNGQAIKYEPGHPLMKMPKGPGIEEYDALVERASRLGSEFIPLLDKVLAENGCKFETGKPPELNRTALMRAEEYLADFEAKCAEIDAEKAKPTKGRSSRTSKKAAEKAPAPAAAKPAELKPGDWVSWIDADGPGGCTQKNFGLVAGPHKDEGFVMLEFGVDRPPCPAPIDRLNPSSAHEFLKAIVDEVERAGLDTSILGIFHGPVANGRDPMCLPVLQELRKKIRESIAAAKPSKEAPDSKLAELVEQPAQKDAESEAPAESAVLACDDEQEMAFYAWDYLCRHWEFDESKPLIGNRVLADKIGNGLLSSADCELIATTAFEQGWDGSYTSPEDIAAAEAPESREESPKQESEANATADAEASTAHDGSEAEKAPSQGDELVIGASLKKESLYIRTEDGRFVDAFTGEVVVDDTEIEGVMEAPEYLRASDGKFHVRDEEALRYIIRRVRDLQREAEAAEALAAEYANQAQAIRNQNERRIQGIYWKYGAEMVSVLLPLLPRYKEGEKAGQFRQKHKKYPEGEIGLSDLGGVEIDRKAARDWVLKHAPDDLRELLVSEVEKISFSTEVNYDLLIQLAENGDLASYEIDAVPGLKITPVVPMGKIDIRLSKPPKSKKGIAEEEPQEDDSAA